MALRLLTDIQVGSEEQLKALGDGAAEKASSKAWEFTGTSSLLKSALQKNVRLGRADAAVRCALSVILQIHLHRVSNSTFCLRLLATAAEPHATPDTSAPLWRNGESCWKHSAFSVHVQLHRSDQYSFICFKK